MKHTILFSIFFLTHSYFLSQELASFDLHAGCVKGLSPVTVKTSSNSKKAHLLADESETTHWESEALLPTGFVKQIHSNYLFQNSQKVVNPIEFKDLKNGFDGDLDTAVDVTDGEMKINLLESKYIKHLFVKIGTKSKVQIYGRSGNSFARLIKTLDINDNYKWLEINLLDLKLTSLILRCTEPFQLFEVAANYSDFRERVFLDFGKKQRVKYLNLIDNRNEGVTENLNIYTSQFQNTKRQINYTIIRENWIELEEEVPLQYILLEYEMTKKNWQKLRISELKVFDKNGQNGEKYFANSSMISLKEMLGVNGYWGFGRNQYSKFSPEGEGVDLYTAIFSHIRTYHDMTWDLKDPDEPIDFKKMADGKGTPAKDWLNWDLEYGDWIKSGVDIQASLQFFRYKDKDWTTPYQSAYYYAYEFARHFGPTHGNGTVCSIEIGNEPWYYDAKIYTQILLGMAKGAKAADPKMEVFPCALQAANPSFEEKDGFKNYIGARVSEEVLPYLDGINVHCYSYDTHDVYKQKALQPEAAKSVFWEILNAIRWRNENMKGKKIYLSEWGWDSAGGGEDCTHNQCVDERDAAAFAIRGALIAHRLGVDRASWFFYANEEGESRNYARSGLTASKDNNFEKKLTYYAFENISKYIGDLYFIGIYKESEDLWGYWYGDKTGKKTHLILWRPVKDDFDEKVVNVRMKNAPKSIFEMPLKEEKVNLEVDFDAGELVLPIGGMPVILEL